MTEDKPAPRAKWGAFYRKKPVIIEAVHCSTAHHAAEHERHALPTWLAEAYERGDVFFLNHPSRIEIRTLEGIMTADYGDLIIKGVAGEIYPCKPHVFAQSYEYVTPEAAAKP